MQSHFTCGELNHQQPSRWTPQMARQPPLLSTYIIAGISCLIAGAYVAALIRVVSI